MNILVTHRGTDMITYKTLGILSQNPEFKIFIALSSDKEEAMVEGNCIPLRIPAIKSKFEYQSIKALRKIIKQYHIDITFSPSTSGLSNILLATWGMNIKNVGYRGTQAKVKRLDPTYYMGLLNPRVSHIVCETEDIKEYLTRYIPTSKLSVAVKPFSTEWVQDAYQHPKQIDNIPADTFKCVYIGSTKNRPFKGLSFLIKGFQLLDSPKAHLIIIGNYDESNYNLARNGKNGERIYFLGQREDAIYFLPKQDLFILPALRDASPRVVREAMACAVPCIVTDIPGARDLISKESGILVPPSSPEEIAKAIHHLMENPQQLKSMSESARKRIIEDFKIEDYVSYFAKLFSSL